MTAYKNIAHRDATTGYQNGGTSATCTVPSTVRTGDLLIVGGAMSDVTGGALALTSTAGSWTALDGSDVTDTNLRTNVWWRVATTADAGSTVTMSWTSSAKAGIVLSAYSGTHATTPIQAASGYATEVEAGTDTTHDAPGITPAGPGYWVAEYVTARGTAALTIAPPAGRTERAEQLGNGLGTVSQIIADSAGAVTYDVASGAKTYTWDGALANAVGWSIALVPAPIDEPPTAPHDIRVELLLGGAWTDVASYVRADDGITLRRGRSGEGSQVDYSRCTLTLDNRDGRFSPRLPTGAYYGTLTRNTQLRVSLPYGSSYLHVPGDQDDRATAPDSAALSITGDIDVRVQADMHWCEDLHLAGKWATTSDERSWLLSLDVYGLVHWSWSTAGTSATASEVRSTASLPVTAGPYAVRVTHDVNNGASGNDVTFYYSTDFSSWTQLGDAVTSTGTTSIYDGTASVEVGNVTEAAISGTTVLWSQERKIMRFECYNGIAGTPVASPRFEYQTAAAATFVDGQGNTWTMSGSSAIDDREYLHCGEVAEWPPTSDVSGNNVTTTIESAGPLRRLGQVGSPVDSAFYRARTTMATAPYGYWPCEDGDGSSQFASPIDGAAAGWWTSAAPPLETHDGFYGSDKLPTVGSSRWSFVTPGVPSGYISATPNDKVVQFLLAIPSGGISSNATLMSIVTNSSARTWDINYTTAGSGGLAWACYDGDGTITSGSSGTITGLDGGNWMVSLHMYQPGDVDVDGTLYVADANDASDAASSVTDTVTGLNSGVIRSVIVNVDNADLGSTSIGHISVHNEDLPLADAAFRDASRGEAAGARFYRLCSEAGMAFRSIGTLGLVSATEGQTAAMGPQRAETLVTLLHECVAADRGQMYELTSALGLGYRTRESLYNQSARVDVDYAANELDAPLSPTDDDQNLRNDVTVIRKGGSSSRALVGDGPLSILNPPDGVGTYDYTETINIAADTQLLNQAAWVAHLGTVDQERHPSLNFALTSNELTTNTGLRDALRGHAPGDRVTVDNPPVWLPPDLITQLAVGATEFLDGFEHRIVLNTEPAAPYRIGVYDEAAAATSTRYTSDGSTLNESLTTAETDMDVATASGPLWTHADGDFDVVVGGERMTVTAVAGSTSPQTFTVTRSVNGVVKTHESGALVELFDPHYYPL